MLNSSPQDAHACQCTGIENEDKYNCVGGGVE